MKAASKLITQLVEQVLGKVISYGRKSDLTIDNIVQLEAQMSKGIQRLALTQQLALTSHFITNKFLNRIFSFDDLQKEKEEELYYNILLFNQRSPIEPFLVTKFLENFLSEINNENDKDQEDVRQGEKIHYHNEASDNTINYENEYDYSYESSGFGSRNKKRLSLSQEETKWLNKVWVENTVFTEVQQCADESAKLFVYVINQLILFFKEKKKKDLFDVLDRLDKKETQNDYEYYGYSSGWYTPATNRVLDNIFKIAENAVRTHYRHTRKRDEAYAYEHLERDLKIRVNLKEFFSSIISQYNPEIQTPSEGTVLKLNELNRARWKEEFKAIKAAAKSSTPKETTQKIYKLFDENTNNVSRANIYFEATKVFIQFNRLETLKCYLQYFAFAQKETKGKIKVLPTSITKKLFTKKEHGDRFVKIVAHLSQTGRLDIALEKVADVYKVERKKIQIDEAEINKINETHKETVEKLNVILTDEVVEENAAESVLKETPIIEEEKSLDDIFGNREETDVDTKIEFNAIHLDLFDLFKREKLSLTNEQISAFAKEKRKLKGQLINKINELFYEQYEDVLIENTEEGYTINEAYIDFVKNI